MTADGGLGAEELWQLIFKLEDEMCAEGIPPNRRHFDLPIEAMKVLGFKAFVTGGAVVPPILKQIRALHGTLFRRKDVAVGVCTVVHSCSAA